jgi:CRISPR-associated protein Cas5t
MELLRIHLKSWTASFRYSSIISGYQPTITVPPLSTLYGILSAAKGEIVPLYDTSMGFVFQSKGKALDIETIYEIEGNLSANKNIMRREFLYDIDLYLYISSLEFKSYFESPVYPLVIGRSMDLANVQEIKTVNLEYKKYVKLGGSIFPMTVKGLYGPIMPLAKSFTDTIPRKISDSQIYYIIDTDFSGKNLAKRPFVLEQEFLYDEELDWGVFLHEQ